MAVLRASCHLGIAVNETSKPRETLRVFPWGLIQASYAFDKEMHYKQGTLDAKKITIIQTVQYKME